MTFGRLERTAGPQPMSDINMTPLIDVMLVLLVIFMITAPLMTSSLKLDLPRSDAAEPSDAPQFLAVAIDARRRALPRRRDARARCASVRGSPTPLGATPDIEVQLRADKRVPYGQVAELIGRVQKAGLNRIGFVTELRQPRRPTRPQPRADAARRSVSPGRFL